MTRINKAKRQNNRQRLLSAAADEFARVGFDGANINTISLTAGFAKGTIYNYFPSKQALLVALIDDTAQIHFDYIQERVLPETDPVRRLEIFFQSGFEFVQDYLSPAKIMFDVVSGADEALKAHTFETYQPMFQFVSEQILKPGIEQGAFRVVEPVEMAILLMTIYLGTASRLGPGGQFWLDPTLVTSLIMHGLMNNLQE